MVEIPKHWFFFHLSSHEFGTFARRLSAMDGGHDSPGLREETALHKSWGFWAVSFWLDVAADVGWLWCVEPVRKFWTVRDCGCSCGARSVTHYAVSQKTCFGYDLRRATQCPGFSSQVHVLSPCRLRNAPALILHNCQRLLEPGASRRARGYGMRTSCCQCWCSSVKWDHSWANDVRSEVWKN